MIVNKFNDIHHVVFVFCLIGFFFFGCKKNKDLNDKTSINKLTLAEEPFVKIEINDTLGNKKEKGVIEFFNKLSDSIKIINKDKRKVSVLFGLKKHEENFNYVNSEDRFENEIYFNPINLTDTIRIPIDITPQFKGEGKAIIVGVLVDNCYLHSYHKTKIRFLEEDFIFKKEVYLKDR